MLQTINGDDPLIWKGEGEGIITLISNGTNWLVKYYTDYGSNTNGCWKKFSSGKIVQNSFLTDANVGNTYFWIYPHPIVNPNSVYIALTSQIVLSQINVYSPHTLSILNKRPTETKAYFVIPTI